MLALVAYLAIARPDVLPATRTVTQSPGPLRTARDYLPGELDFEVE